MSSKENRPLRWLFEDRLALVLIATVYPAWAVLFEWLHFPGTQDSLKGRLYVALYASFWLGLSYINERVRSLLSWIAASAITLTTLHYFYLVWFNHYHTVYAIGAFVTVLAASAIFNRRYFLLAYSILTLITSWVSAADTEMSFRIFFTAGIGTALAITYIGTSRRLVHLEAESRSRLLIEEQQAQLMNASKMSALGEMAGGVAHEINNPLAIIQILNGQTEEVLQDQNVNKELLIKNSKTIDETVRRIAKIVSGLRSFSKDTSHEPHARLQFKNVLEDVLALCSERLANHGIKLRINGSPEGFVTLGNTTLLSQVILGLLNNAHDAIENLPEKWIEISFVDQGSSFEVRVSNSGPRISQKVQAKLFQPFFTTKQIGKGTGLGLSTALGIVESHNGKLWLDAKAPHTTFVLSLPKDDSQKTAA